jgi:signal transduction histidine kinase
MELIKKMKVTNLIFGAAVLLCVLFYLYWSGFVSSFSNEGFMPHGHCYLWQPGLVWTMLFSDLWIGMAYVSISICLYILVRRIRLPFSMMFLAFGAFIAACGATHFMEVYTLWFPNYWLAALVKVITALASVATAFLMFPLFPKVVQFAAGARLSEDRRRRLEIMNQDLQSRTDELLALNYELQSFSYSVSHDLRAPLRGINGFSEALLEDYSDKIDDKGREYLRYIQQGSNRMGQIIDDLLNLSKVTRTELKPSKLDLTAIAKDAINMEKSRDPARKVDTLIQEGVTGLGDQGLIRLVIENLISNAWKFSAKNAGARIEFGSILREGRTVYFVRDNGSGFDMKFANKLFGAFQRLHSPEEYEGTGIGLATAKRIIRRHGGDIEAESEPGKGTTFHFTLGVKL